MNPNEYGYYYPQNTPTNGHSWSREDWEYSQQQYQSYAQNYNRASYNDSYPASHVRSQSYKSPQSSSSLRSHYYNGVRAAPTTARYPRVVNPYNGTARTSIPNQYKRSRLESVSTTSDSHVNKPSKKKKKPLSQNVPKNNWTIVEAEWALSIEKELNKKTKNSLIIKFPDEELNKDIVSLLHGSIDSVHFKQPCTPRFCYVTLQDSANPEEVIKEINKQKFGSGYLVAEYKRDREEDMVINAEDIDPLTLYVGNLDQEVTKDAIQKMFPNSKRMDIGFAKKMKFTRYAFIGFRTVADAVEAFRNTHNNELYNKSIIVRFRRLHGTVGLPGESKVQNAPKGNEADNVRSMNSSRNDTSDVPMVSLNQSETNSLVDILDMAIPPPPPPPLPKSPVDKTVTANVPEKVNLKQRIKQEVETPEDEMLFDEFLTFSPQPELFESYLNMNKEDVECKPKIEIKDKIKVEKNSEVAKELREEDPTDVVVVKTEPNHNEDEFDNFDMYYGEEDNEEEKDHEEEIFYEEEEDNEEEDGLDKTNFDDIYENMVNQDRNLRSLQI